MTLRSLGHKMVKIKCVFEGNRIGIPYEAEVFHYATKFHDISSAILNNGIRLAKSYSKCNNQL